MWLYVTRGSLLWFAESMMLTLDHVSFYLTKMSPPFLSRSRPKCKIPMPGIGYSYPYQSVHFQARNAVSFHAISGTMRRSMRMEMYMPQYAECYMINPLRSSLARGTSRRGPISFFLSHLRSFYLRSRLSGMRTSKSRRRPPLV